MKPAWHYCLLLITTFNCFSNTLYFHMDADHPSLNINLPANPTTGFTWQLISYDKQVLSFNGQTYVSTYPKNIGSPGVNDFSFTLLPHDPNIKTTKLTLIYARQWEKNTGNITQVIVDLNPIPK